MALASSYMLTRRSKRHRTSTVVMINCMATKSVLSEFIFRSTNGLRSEVVHTVCSVQRRLERDDQYWYYTSCIARRCA